MASFVVQVPDEVAWDVTSALAQSRGYPGDATDESNAAGITEFVCQSIANELSSQVAQVLYSRAQQAALATVEPPTAPAITIAPGT